MSVVASKRGHSKFEPVIKAQIVAKHILIITKNEKIFDVAYKALTEDIIHSAEHIYIFSFTANNKRQKNHIKGLVRAYGSGKISKEKLENCYDCLRNHTSKGNTYYYLQKLDKFYKGEVRKCYLLKTK